jgi:hypothetical protein
MEVIDLGALDDLEPISIDVGTDTKSINSSKFGSGIELLMNDKKFSSNRNTNANLNLGELDNLENELNELSSKGQVNKQDDTRTLTGMAANLFGFGNKETDSNKIKMNEPDTDTSDNIGLGQATRNSMGNAKTWDGFSKMNEIPLNAEKNSTMNEREQRRKKRAMIKKLDEWYEKGLIKHSSKFNMESAFDEVEDEYETALEDKRKKDSIKLQGWWFMTFINSMEYANTVFNPFDLNLDGWGEQVNEDIDSYEEIFSELHDKYKGGKLAPELSLLLRVGFSAAVLNFSNKALSSATPAFNDVIKQSPELMKMFTNATVSTMSQSSPGFAMANNFVQDNTKPRGPPPPAPVDTQKMPPPQRPGMIYTNDPPSNRPDINASRGEMFREKGVDVSSEYNINAPARSIPTPQQPPVTRPEMRGPQSSDIDNILAGLKTRNVNIRETVPQPSTTQMFDEDSILSISSLKDMQNSNMPKRSNRKKNRSDKNTVSLDI